MENISASQLKSRLDAGEKIVLVDVREPSEHNEYNIGGILLPLGAIQSMQTEQIEQYKDQEVVLYCRSGNRSGQACMFLETMGFRNVKNLQGGMLEWRSREEKNDF